MKLVDRIMKRSDLIWDKDYKKLPFIFWGCGNNARIVKRLLEEKGVIPSAFCDNNPQLIGREIDGVKILSYKQVLEQYKEYCIVLTVAINNAIPILEQLEKAGEKNPIIHMEKPFKVDEEFLEYDYLESNLDDFEAVYNMMEDELSKELFVGNIDFKLSGNKVNLMRFVDGDTFFDSKMIPASKKHSYVDVGAYTGDTLLRFYAFCGGNYERIYAVEPDSGNFLALSQLVKYGRLDNVSLFEVGGWDCKDELTFYTIDKQNDRNFDSPNFFKDMSETVPNSWGIAEEHYTEVKICVDTVDHLLNGEDCSLIKINALAADLQTLKGCKETIRRCRPIFVGEFGTRKENMTEMILFINEYGEDYRFYLRQKMIFGDCKTVFYAVPRTVCFEEC